MSRRANSGTAPEIAVTVNVRLSGPAIPPTKLPVIVITSPTSKLVPAAFTATDCIPPLALVTSLNVAHHPQSFLFLLRQYMFEMQHNCFHLM